MDIYIAAPFGNYIKPDNTIPVLGTFTALPRPGLIKQLLKTLRYDFTDKCWYNSLGLRNPGVNKGIKRIKPNQVLSIAAIYPADWDLLDAQIPLHIPLEINISCPNINHFKDYIKPITKFQSRNPIIKLSPHMTRDNLNYLIDEGFTKFHASNTFKTDKGARSGKILQPFTIDTIHYIKDRLGDKSRVIAGGGITHLRDILKYTAAGADDFSLGTVCFNPIRLNKLLSALEP